MVEGTACHCCGAPIDTYYCEGKEVKLRHLSILRFPTYLLLTPPRYQCIHCPGEPTTTQAQPWYDQRTTYTKEFAEYILLSLINSTIKDVEIKERVGYDVIESMIENGIDTRIDWDKVKRIDVIGIDEISLKKGHQDFVTIITAFVDGELRILTVLEDRKKATVKRFFLSIPKRLRKNVKAICSDLYEGFMNAAKEVFGKKIPVVADRFHVAKLYRNGVDNLRKKEMKRLKDELPEEDYNKLKNVMWILRKESSELNNDEREILKLLFKHSPDLKLAYRLRNDLTKIFDSQINPGQAKRKIKGWMRRVGNTKLTCFNTFLKTLSKQMEPITNYFIDRHNSGFVEGLNNKIKVIKRRCYGLTNIKHLFQRILLDMEGYSLFSWEIKGL